jgi:hypothetical protein
MPMQFCNPCGNLLPETQNPEVECDCCGVMSKSAYLSLLRLECVTKELCHPRHLDRHCHRVHRGRPRRSAQNAMAQQVEKDILTGYLDQDSRGVHKLTMWRARGALHCPPA